MRFSAPHAVFAAILVGSLAARALSANAFLDEASVLEPGVLRVAGSHGLGLREYRTTGGMVSRALVFQAPDCSQPVYVSLRLSTFEEQTLLESAPERGYSRRYIYFDRTWDTPDPWAAFAQRMKYAALSVFGLTRYVPSRYLLSVEAPVDCRAVEAIDWRYVWNPTTSPRPKPTPILRSNRNALIAMCVDMSDKGSGLWGRR